MTVLPAHPLTFDLSLTITIYDNWNQVIRRTFPLRNLQGAKESAQVTHAKSILNEVAAELHFLTNHGIDKGTIKVAGKKVADVVFPAYQPHVKVKYFSYGITFPFSPIQTYQWVKKDETRTLRKWRLAADELNEGWQREEIRRMKTVSFKLPCLPSHPSNREHFFHHLGAKKRGRKVVGWQLNYDRKNAIYQRFVSRFYPDGNLSIGEKRYWVATGYDPILKGVSWPLPNYKKTKMPRKSQLASQPKDDTDYVYIIRMGRTKMYKIGKSNDPKGRLSNLQTASPYKLKLLHTFTADNASTAEEALHAHFHAQRMEGEWFKLSDEEKNVLLSVNDFKQGRFGVKGKWLDAGALFSS